jgi:hypothetical protein
MIHRIEQDDSRRRLTVFAQGSITFEDIVGVIWWQLREGLWSYSMIYDESGAMSVLTEADLHRIILLVENLSSRYGLRGPVAVVSEVDATFASAEFYRDLAAAKGHRFKAFREIGAATRWMTGAPDTQARPTHS